MAIASGLLSFVGIAAIVLAVAWSLGQQRINAAGPLAADKVVTIAPGTDVSGIVDQLAEEGVIESRPLMTAELWIEHNRSKVKAGEYLFKQSASLREVIDTLVSGKQILHSVTIPEGLTSEQIVDRLRQNDVLVGDIRQVPQEGTLMPDTYKFARGTTRDQVIRNMEAEQKRVLAEVWSHRATDTPIRSSYELLTLASIVEKETGRADERPRIAGVFVNRLARNMPLQSDPTIVYGLVGGKGTLGRGILKSEVEQKTPYNTYTMVGLPPGPIDNPGKAALEAVANPSRTKDLYFVADGTGGHVFAETLDQHRVNVQRWRQIEKDAKDKLGTDIAKPAPATVQPSPVPRSNQRGDIGGSSIYGGLDIGSSEPGRVAGLGSPPLMTGFPLGGFAGNAALAPPNGAAHTAVGPSSNFDELDVELAGVKSKPDPAEAAADAGGSAESARSQPTGSMATFPVSPQRLADEKARALAYGLQPASDHLPGPDASSPAPADPPARSSLRFGKVAIIDASEGTSFDPLRDRSYDLNSGKTVPAMKALPPVLPVSSYAN